jgi:hypothetical protein
VRSDALLAFRPLVDMRRGECRTHANPSRYSSSGQRLEYIQHRLRYPRRSRCIFAGLIAGSVSLIAFGSASIIEVAVQGGATLTAA